MKDQNQYCVIMLGGVGSRFWPLSKENKPKQFLDILGIGKTLLQTTFHRFAKIIPTSNILIATNHTYKELVINQIPEISPEQILCEPIRRGTLPCVAYAAYRIAEKNPNAVMIATPCDHWVADEEKYLKCIQHGMDVAGNQPILLTLGVKPHRPETAYGYVQSSDKIIATNISKIKTLTEKPNIELANLFYESGEYLWNSGLFMWNVNTIKHTIRTLYPDISNQLDLGIGHFNTDSEADFMNRSYPFMPNISIDFGMMEKTENSYVLEGDFGWCDVGTWGALYDLTHKDNMGNVSHGGKTIFYNSSENIVSLSDGRLAVIQGLDGYIVAETNNVLLICKKSEQQKVKQFVSDVKFSCNEEYL